MNGSVNLNFDNLCYQVPKRFLPSRQDAKQILNCVSGEFRFGELSAVIGASGSGKSSLLNVLSGYKHVNVSGSIKINKNQVSSNIVRKLSSYVMQDNKLHEYLTVYETVTFAAHFKMRESASQEKKIVGVLKSLGMDDHSDTFVKNLSGGQQKRLTIAIELIDNPSIVFLDEPTSGLDSYSSMQCIQLLKRLAQEGKTIICTIHTPSASMFELFDNIYALADGFCIYQGSSPNLVPFLSELDLICPETFSPSDFLLEIATNDYGLQNHRLTEKMRNGCEQNYRTTTTLPSITNQNLSNPIDFQSSSRSIYSLSFFEQVKHLSHRSILISKRDKTLTITRLLIHLMIGIVFGIIYKNIGDEASNFLDNYRYIITSIVFQLYTAYFSLQTASELDDHANKTKQLTFQKLSVPLAYPILKREHFNRWYSTSAYFISLVLVDVPITFLCSFTYVTITYTMTSQPPEFYRYLAFLTLSLALSFAAQGVGVAGSALLDIKVTSTILSN